MCVCVCVCVCVIEWFDFLLICNVIPAFHIFDTSLRNKDGSCYVFKTGTNRYRLPGYIHHVTKEWTHTRFV